MPLERENFAKYFFEVFDSLSQHDLSSDQSEPRYLQLLLLVAFHSFIREGVNAAVVETHHGGQYDSTNVVENPVVTAITSLGMDHIKQLGPTLQNIAWHKAGIFKHGAYAFSVAQESSIMNVF